MTEHALAKQRMDLDLYTFHVDGYVKSGMTFEAAINQARHIQERETLCAQREETIKTREIQLNERLNASTAIYYEKVLAEKEKVLLQKEQKLRENYRDNMSQRESHETVVIWLVVFCLVELLIIFLMLIY